LRNSQEEYAVSAQQEPTAATPFLMGDQLYLHSLEKEDLPHIRRWANDPEVRRLTGEVLPMSQAAAEEFYERVRTDKERVWFVVVLKEGERVIGEAGLLRMFPAWRTTDMSIIIGDKAAWGQGYGVEAARLLLDFAFGALNMHRVAVGVVSFNERALHFWEKVGFRREGLQRDGYYCDHAYHDFVMMSVLEDEFRRMRNDEINPEMDVVARGPAQQGEK
jgi:RimJ/RimL family protein N-acetyltransferase